MGPTSPLPSSSSGAGAHPMRALAHIHSPKSASMVAPRCAGVSTPRILPNGRRRRRVADATVAPPCLSFSSIV